MKRIISAVLVCILMVGCVFALASCGGPNKDPEAAKKALEDADYIVELEDEFDEDSKLEAAIEAYSEDGKNLIEIYYFADAKDAKEAYDEAKENLDDMKELYKELGIEAEIELGKSGKMVWMGTKDAIKAAK